MDEISVVKGVSGVKVTFGAAGVKVGSGVISGVAGVKVGFGVVSGVGVKYTDDNAGVKVTVGAGGSLQDVEVTSGAHDRMSLCKANPSPQEQVKEPSVLVQT